MVPERRSTRGFSGLLFIVFNLREMKERKRLFIIIIYDLVGGSRVNMWALVSGRSVADRAPTPCSVHASR